MVAGPCLAEICLRCFSNPWAAKQLAIIKASLVKFRSATDDDERQATLLNSGFHSLQIGLIALTLMLLLIAVAAFPPWILEWQQPEQTAYLAISSLSASLWWLVRRKKFPSNKPMAQKLLHNDHGYSRLQRWAHWLALEPKMVRSLSFDLERHFFLPERPPLADPAAGAVYVCGMPRSGTTILLRILDEIDDFKSLCYRDMPFVLAPNLWRRITERFPQHVQSTERTHGDGLWIDLDSPESFEEVFWRTFDDPASSKANPNALISAAVMADFADYRALVANPRSRQGEKAGKLRRYLSKNNNNLSRLHSLCADPTAAVLFVFRNPVDTTWSSLRQHQRTLATKADPFTDNYRKWLGHHEFGLDHQPAKLAVPSLRNDLTPDDPNYWLAYWIAVHSAVLAQQNLRLTLVNHDQMRDDPTGFVSTICSNVKVTADIPALASLIKPPSQTGQYREALNPIMLAAAKSLHLKLLDRTEKISS
jgi:hypothetical protein